MAHPPEPRRGTYLPTGWRVVGPGAQRIAEQAAAADERLVPGDVSQTLYAFQCTAEPVVRGRATVERVLDRVTEEIRHVHEDCPRLVRDEEVARPPSRFGGLRYEVMVEPGKGWLGEVLWRGVHPVVAGAPITTWVLIEERASFTRLSVRVTADEGLASVRGYVGAGQARPDFMIALRPEVTPIWMGAPLVPHTIREGGMADFVQSILADPRRDVTVALLSPKEDGGFVVDPGDLAWELLGRARLYVMDSHQQTFALTDLVGDRRMSCYRGAVRCYFPGWSRHDDPYEHPLLLGEPLEDPVLRATWTGQVGLWMGLRVELPPSIGERRAPQPSDEEQDPPRLDPVPEAAPPSALAEAPLARVEAAGPVPAGEGEEGSPERDSHPSDRPHQAQPAMDLRPWLEGVVEEVRGLGSLVTQLTDEVERLRAIAALRSSSTNAIERRLGRLEDILEQAFPDGSGTSPLSEGAVEAGPLDEEAAIDDARATLDEVVHDAAESYADALVFLDSSFKSAGDSPYEDPERVRAVLEAMARVARRRRDGVLGTSLREAFSDVGIEYRSGIARNTSERLREQYRFVRENRGLVEAEEHIVLGNTYDPRRCLRIYFSSRVPNEPRFVIGHVGRHFEVQSST